jgi:hypothetical protein
VAEVAAAGEAVAEVVAAGEVEAEEVVAVAPSAVGEAGWVPGSAPELDP